MLSPPHTLLCHLLPIGFQLGFWMGGALCWRMLVYCVMLRGELKVGAGSFTCL